MLRANGTRHLLVATTSMALVMWPASARASGAGAVGFLSMLLPALLATFVGLLGVGLLLVERAHRAIFLALFVAAWTGAWALSHVPWLSGWPALLVGTAPLGLALWDRGRWKALLAAAVLGPLAFFGYGWLFARASAANRWLEPLVSALPLVPFVVAAWTSGYRRVALFTIPAFVASAYVFFLTT